MCFGTVTAFFVTFVSTICKTLCGSNSKIPRATIKRVRTVSYRTVFTVKASADFVVIVNTAAEFDGTSVIFVISHVTFLLSSPASAKPTRAIMKSLNEASIGIGRQIAGTI